MEEVGLVVLGAVVGAVATGGVSFYAEVRRDRLARKVAARLILGDLFLIDAFARITVDDGHWGRLREWREPGETWQRSREAFAASVKAWEWALVDSAFRRLAEVEHLRKDEPITEGQITFLRSVSQAAVDARAVVLPHVAPGRELAETVRQLEGGLPGVTS